MIVYSIVVPVILAVFGSSGAQQGETYDFQPVIYHGLLS
jgi:hypothetical protein